MALSGANMALEGGDPRDKTLAAAQVPASTGVKHHDSSVSFEEYHYWAKIARADEWYENPNHDYTIFGKVLKKSRHPPADVQLAEATGDALGEHPAGERSGSDEKIGEKQLAEKGGDAQRQGSRAFVITDEEYVTASRAIRTATWGAVFYLITTDILGPFAVPWAMAAVSLDITLTLAYSWSSASCLYTNMFWNKSKICFYYRIIWFLEQKSKLTFPLDGLRSRSGIIYNFWYSCRLRRLLFVEGFFGFGLGPLPS